MQKLATFFLAITLLFQNATAQDNDKNISIQQATEEYKFVKGNKDNPVQIKQTQETVYMCNEFRTTISIAEFYDNQVQIDDVDTWVNGDKQKAFGPRYEPYSVDGIFYSDAKVCYFGLPFERKGTASKVRFEKTVLDPRYFTS